MFSQIKFVTGNSNKARETAAILDVPLEQVKVDGLIEIQTQDIEELVSVSYTHLTLPTK